VAVAWSDDDGIAIDDDPFGSALGGRRGRGWVVGPDLRLRREVDGGVPALDVDERGIPRLADARTFPLEA
jgi:hypothetical protein